MQADQVGSLGSHEAPICQVFWIQQYGVLMSLGFDSKLKFWNLSNNGSNLIKQFQLPSKTHTAAYDYPYLMVGTADGKLGFLKLDDLKNFKIDQHNFYDIV